MIQHLGLIVPAQTACGLTLEDLPPQLVVWTRERTTCDPCLKATAESEAA